MILPPHQNSEKEIRVVFCLIIFVAAILRIYIATLDINILLDQGLIQDDAFYYYVIAHNIIEHGLSSFDAINLTNGFHPLWQAVCLPIFYFWHDETPLRLMLLIASCFDLLSIYLLFLILRKISRNPYAALIAAAILAFHGTIIRTWFNGLETALSIFSLLWLLHQFLYIKEKKSISLKDHCWLGLIAAFSFLSRTDNAIAILVIFYFLYTVPLITKKEFKHGLAASLIFIGLISPWLTWNIVNFGSIVQISGKIRDNTWLVGNSPVDMSILQAIVYGISSSLTPIRIVFEKLFSPAQVSSISGYIYILLFIIFVVLALRKNSIFKKSVYLMFPFFLGVTILFLYHAGIRHFVRGWYNAPVLLVLTILLCLLIDGWLARTKNRYFPQGLFALICIVLLILYSPLTYTRNSAKIHTDPRVAAAEWINHNTPVNAIIGAANAGIMGYYTKRPVINLDGVVNEAAFRARLANNLQRYIEDAHIDYLADHKGSIAHLCKDNPFYSCTRADNLEGATLVMRISK